MIYKYYIIDTSVNRIVWMYDSIEDALKKANESKNYIALEVIDVSKHGYPFVMESDISD